MASAGTASIDVTGDFSGFTKGAEDAGQGFLSKASSWGKAAAALIGPALAIGAVVGLAEIGDQFDSAFDKIRIGTGQTGENLEALQGSFKNVFSSVPASMDDVSDAITGISQRLGLTGKPLEDLTTQFINLSRITDTDVAANIESATGVFNQFGISAEEQGTKLDELFRVTQLTGISFGELTGALGQGGVAFRNAGLTFEESAGLLGLLAKNGLSASDVLPSLSRSMATAAKDGKSAADVFQSTFDAIKNAPDDTKAAGVALDVFGAKAGPKFAALIREGKLSYEEFAATIANGGDTINQAASDTDDWREKLEIFKNKALVALEPIASTVFDALGRGIDWLTVSIDDFSKSDAWGNIQDGFHAAFDWIANVGAPAIGTAFVWLRDTIVPALGIAFGWITTTVVPALVGAFQWLSDIIVPALGKAFDWISDVAIPAVVDAFDDIKKWFASNWPTIAAAFQKAWDGIQTGFEWLIDHKPVLIGVITALSLVLLGPLTTAIAAVVLAWLKFEGFREVVENLTTWITQTAWPALQQFFNQIIEKITDFADGWADRWEDIKTSVMTVITVLTVAVGVALAPLIFIWTQAHDQIMAVVQAVWGFIGSYIQAALDVILGIIDVVLGLLSGDWSRAWDGVKQILQGVWDGIVALVTLSIETVKQVIIGALAVLAGLWQVAWDGLKSVLSTAWDGIKTVVSTGIDGVVTLITELPGKAVAALASLASSLEGVAKSAMASMYLAFNTGLSALLTFFSELPGNLISALGDLASKFAQVGRDIISAIADAIRNASGLIASAIKDAALGALGSIGGVIGDAAGAIGSVLGFDSGGVVPGSIGQPRFAVVHGGEVVLNRNQQAETLFAMANGAPATTGYEGGQGLVVNNYGVASDPQTLAAMTAAELTWSLRTRAA